MKDQIPWLNGTETSYLNFMTAPKTSKKAAQAPKKCTKTFGKEEWCRECDRKEKVEETIDHTSIKDHPEFTVLLAHKEHPQI